MPKKLPQFWGFLPSLIFPKNMPQFLGFHPEPNFPKKLPQFWDCHPGPNSPKNLPHFLNFSRIQTLGTFVLRFGYFEFTACVYRSFEFIIRFKACISDFGGCDTTLLGAAGTKTSVMPTDISSPLVVGMSVFLVPLTLHWKSR